MTDVEKIVKRLDELEKENKALRDELVKVKEDLDRTSRRLSLVWENIVQNRN